ncbi:unnamed protein product, partial [Staurois parvus]
LITTLVFNFLIKKPKTTENFEKKKSFSFGYKIL